MISKVLKSKIYRATILQANLDYFGSVYIGDDMVEDPNFVDFEMFQAANNNNGEMIEMNLIRGERVTGDISLNGASALKDRKNNLDSLVSFAQMESEKAKKHKPAIVFPTPQNKLN